MKFTFHAAYKRFIRLKKFSLSKGGLDILKVGSTRILYQHHSNFTQLS